MSSRARASGVRTSTQVHPRVGGGRALCDQGHEAAEAGSGDDRRDRGPQIGCGRGHHGAEVAGQPSYRLSLGDGERCPTTLRVAPHDPPRGERQRGPRGAHRVDDVVRLGGLVEELGAAVGPEARVVRGDHGPSSLDEPQHLVAVVEVAHQRRRARHPGAAAAVGVGDDRPAARGRAALRGRGRLRRRPHRPRSRCASGRGSVRHGPSRRRRGRRSSDAIGSGFPRAREGGDEGRRRTASGAGRRPAAAARPGRPGHRSGWWRLRGPALRGRRPPRSVPRPP